MDIVMGESPQSTTGARWVCPNDRHLALRAKLRTGWSVKTGYFDSGWNNYPGAGGVNRAGQSFVLTEEERRTIVQVIQRAEALDLSEQKRIGRLVERLEDMKRNVRIITSSRSDERRNCGSRCSGGSRCVCSCALCGEKFGAVLGASPTFCKDCRKYVCQKCGREATGVLSSSTTSNIGEPLSSSSPSSTASASATVRRKLSANEPQPKRTAIQRIVQRTTNTNPQKLFLCRICAESREIWKKSGAWFFKGMPKHDPPTKKKERDWSRQGHRTQLGQSSCRIISVCKSLESNEAQDSSSDEDMARRLTTGNRRGSSSSPSLQGNQDNGLDTAQFVLHGVALSPSGSSIAIATATTTVMTATTTTATTTTTTTAADGITMTMTMTTTTTTTNVPTTDRLDKSTLPILSTQRNRLSPSSASTAPISPRANVRTNERSSFEDNASSNDAAETRMEENAGNERPDDDFLDDPRSSIDRSFKGSQVQSVRWNYSPSTSSPGSTLMERIQEEAWMHEKNAEREANRGSDRTNDGPIGTMWYVHHSDSSKQQTSLDRHETTRCETEEDFGTLEVSLLYDPVAQCLQCKVERALGLKPMDIHDLADPFCKINILPVGMGTNIKHVRTKTVHKTRDPVFNETVNFYVSKDADMKSGRALHVMILQDDPSGEDFLGEARFPLYELEPFQTRHYKVALQNHYPVSREEEAWGIGRGNRGQIQLTLSYCTRRRALLVTIHQAMNLLPMDNNGFSDPFVKLCLVENATTDGRRRQKRGHDPLARPNTKKYYISKKLLTAGSRSSYSTSVKWKTLSPEWNEEFVFGIRLTDLTKVTLCLSMWDKDFGKSNDYLGGLALGCNSKGARLRHWIDVIKFPDCRHPAWHNLTEVLFMPPAE